MSQQIIRDLEKQYMRAEAPAFDIGDTLGVHVKIVEAGKERIQVFTGTVIAMRGRGINRKFTVRRIVAGEGVERVFPLHSPKVAGVEVTRRNRVRRAKLYFLRDRVGKATRLQEIRQPSAKARAKAEAAEKARAEAEAQPEPEPAPAAE